MKKVEWSPGKLLETSGSYWQSCTLHAGVKLGVFSLIGNGSFSSENIAEKLHADPRGTRTFLNALSAMSLLRKTEDTYSNTPAAATFLSKDSPKYIGHIIMHHHHLVSGWGKLDQAVVSGKPVRERSSHGEETERESFLMGMFNMAMAIAPGLSKTLDLSKRRSLLDLGGGPGTYAIHFCLENPSLNATVFDLPTTRPFAEKTIEKFQLTGRVHFMEGSFLTDQVGGSYDVAWLSHILHGESPDACFRIIQKAASTLEPGGVIFIHEFILNNSMDGPLFPAIFSLNMLLGTSGGRSYSEAELREMLTRSGVKEIARLDFMGPTESGIIYGTV